MEEGDPVTVDGQKGRICKINADDTACVIFAGGVCMRIGLEALQPASEPAPACTEDCRAGC